MRKTITEADFVNNLHKSRLYFRSIDRPILKYQSDKVSIAEVMPDFYHLPNVFVKLCEELFITAKGRDYLSTLVQDRFQFMYGFAHGLSYLLDAALIGNLMSKTRRSLEDAHICKQFDNGYPVDNDRLETFYLQYT